MSKSEQDKNPITKRTKKKKTKKDKKKKQKKRADKSKVPKGITININVGKSGGDAKAKASKTAKGFAPPRASFRGQRGRGNLSDNSRQAEMNTNLMQNIFGVRSLATQQGQDLRDLTGNFNSLRERVEGLGTQTLNNQNQQLALNARDETHRRYMEQQVRENAERQRQALDMMQNRFTQEATDTRRVLAEGQARIREGIAQDSTDTRWALTQAHNAVANDILTLQGGLANTQQSIEDATIATTGRQQQALTMMQQHLTREAEDTRQALQGGLANTQQSIEDATIATTERQNQTIEQGVETQNALALVAQHVTGVSREQGALMNDLTRLEGNIARGGEHLVRLQGDINRGGDAFAQLRRDTVHNINQLQNDMNNGFTFVAQQGGMNTEAVQQIAGNLAVDLVMPDIWGDDDTQQIVMTPETPLLTTLKTAQQPPPMDEQRPPPPNPLTPEPAPAPAPQGSSSVGDDTPLIQEATPEDQKKGRPEGAKTSTPMSKDNIAQTRRMLETIMGDYYKGSKNLKNDPRFQTLLDDGANAGSLKNLMTDIFKKNKNIYRQRTESQQMGMEDTVELNNKAVERRRQKEKDNKIKGMNKGKFDRTKEKIKIKIKSNPNI